MDRIFASTEPLDAQKHRILTCSDRYATPTAERVLPDGAVHLIFNLGDRQSGERGAELSCLAVGATCAPTRIVLNGVVEQVCVRLKVGAAAAILGIPAGELTDHGVSLDAVWGAAAPETLERLHAAAPGPPRAALIADLLRARVRRADAPSRVTLEAVRRIAATNGRLRVAELAAALGLSDRRLQQLFHQHVGLSPRAMSRLARFRDVLGRCSKRDRPWAEIALDGGFYDQAHFANEVRTFTGLTPSELARGGDFGFLQEDCAAHA